MILRLGVIVSLGFYLVACDGSTQSGPGPGEPCQFVHTSLVCNAGASLCCAAGRDSSCGGGALCIGDGNGMTCAYTCKQTSDCTAISTTATCMQECTKGIINGFCVEPSARTDLLLTTCSTPEDGAVGIVVVY